MAKGFKTHKTPSQQIPQRETLQFSRHKTANNRNHVDECSLFHGALGA